MMKSSSDAGEGDFVAVDMPEEGMGTSPTAVSAIDPPDRDEETSRRSVLQELWSEAGASDLPAPINARLHHRRTTRGAKPRKGSHGAIPGMSPSKLQRSLRHRYRATRGARIAKRVWLAMFAALAASFLIAIHVFLYGVFTGGNTGSGGGGSYGPILKNGMSVLGVEDREAKMTLQEAHAHRLASINAHAIDTTQYTVRMNTWRRNEQLLLSLNHHATCDGVKEIQVIWCDSENEPPKEVAQHASGKVRVERHAINSLNERFKVLLDPPTLGILSLDDDVLRPCVALDAAFVRWTRHPDRMVGFDARTHVVADEEEGGTEGKSQWKYGYMSTTEKANRYTLTLPRASFLHRDYLDMYVMALPRPIYSYVATNLECEDVAMSFLVSSLTNGRPPLLADYWAVKSMVKLYSATKISGGKGHKSTRDKCVNDFAEWLGLKEDGEWPLRSEKLLHGDKFFGYGAEPEEWANVDAQTLKSSRLKEVVEELGELKSSSGEDRMQWLVERKAETMAEAQSAGMIERTAEWRERWEADDNEEERR
ncbi:hypothetical protein ACHAXT_005671 [Thalassiosira profunda]